MFKAEDLEFYVRYNILSEMLEHSKVFKPLDFTNTLELFENELKTATLLNDFTFVNDQLTTAIKIAKKIGVDHKIWHNERGNSYLKLAKNIINEDRYWIKQDYHSKAIQEFKLAKNIEKRKEVEKLYADLKPLIKLPTISIPYTEENTEYFKET